MRIGRTIIDTDNMTAEELSTIICELRKVRSRKLKVEELTARMNDLIADAKENGFTFIDKHYGNVWESTDFILFDEQANCFQ